jgi:Uma2 family endonuclease
MSETATKLVTADELLEMGDIGRCELMYGEIVMMSPAGGLHGIVAARIARDLSNFVEAHNLGEVVGAETGFLIETDPDLVRAPDAAFLKKPETPLVFDRQYIKGVPDLAVEVISFNDTKREVLDKANMWLAHGTKVVWVLDPGKSIVEIHRVAQATTKLGLQQSIQDEPLLPGFTLAVAQIFKSPQH